MDKPDVSVSEQNAQHSNKTMGVFPHVARKKKNLTCVILKGLNATHLEKNLPFEVPLKALLTQEREVFSVTEKRQLCGVTDRRLAAATANIC